MRSLWVGSGHSKWVLLFGAVLLSAPFFPYTIFAQSPDEDPPKMSNIQIATSTEDSITITWDTDEIADSMVNSGLDKGYGIFRDPVPDKKKHKVVMTGLDPDTTYHFRAVSSDTVGNQSVSGDYIVKTRAKVGEEDMVKVPRNDRSAVETAVDAIDEIKTTEGLKVVAKKLKSKAEEVIGPPAIIGRPNVQDIGVDRATIVWASSRPASSMVSFAPETQYRPESEDPYPYSQGEPNEKVTDHEIVLTGLQPATTYHAMVMSEDEYNLQGKSRDVVFVTKSVLPSVSSARIIKVEENSATIGWNTVVPSSGIIEYTDVKNKKVFLKGDPIFQNSHTVKLGDLTLGTRYTVMIKAENKNGDRAQYGPLSFVTVKDIAPPLISKVNNESTLYPSADAKVQTIVSWSTDEPAACQFFYRDGANPNAEASTLELEKEPRTAHVQVIVEFLPSTVYQFWVDCKDRSGNPAESEKFVLFTPNKEKSILDIILENFSSTFGWVKNIGK